MTSAGLAIASLRHRPLRTLFGLVLLVAANMLLVFSLSATKRAHSVLDGFDEHSVMIIPFRDDDLPIALVARVRSALGEGADVQWNAYRRGGTPDQSLSFPMLFSTDDYFESYPQHGEDLTPGTRERWLADRQGLILSHDALRRLGKKVGDTVTLAASFGTLQARISGLTASESELMVFSLHYEYLAALRPTEARIASITVHHVADVDRAIGQLRDQLAASDPPVLVLRERMFHARMAALSAALPDLLNKVSLVFACSTLLFLFSNVFVSLRERRSELGALRAIGFRRRRLLALVISEYVVVSVLAGVLGAGVPYALFHSEGIRLGGLAIANVPIDPLACVWVVGGGLSLGSLIILAPALMLVTTDTTRLLSGR